MSAERAGAACPSLEVLTCLLLALELSECFEWEILAKMGGWYGASHYMRYVSILDICCYVPVSLMIQILLFLLKTH